jgi:NAD(P)-dependent dehydrogenase (short-subunit alcohol dehydrogenase family)
LSRTQCTALSRSQPAARIFTSPVPPEQTAGARSDGTSIGSTVAGVQGDVVNLADLDRLYESVKAKGRIDILFANVGLDEF